MDLAVNQEAGMLLYRLHDDLWLCGEPSKCAKAWTTIERCATRLGLEFNDSKTGPVYLADDMPKDPRIQEALPKGRVILGFLELDGHTGEWVIDHTQVDAHIKQLSKQLADCSSIFSWIQTWNSCIGRFFNYTFGQPANCFGQRHVDMILASHQQMQQKLFANDGKNVKPGSVTEYLQRTIEDRLKITNVPDAFLYFPEGVGGLGVRNPFISFLVVREQLLKDPKARMTEFLKQERESYKVAKANFDALNERDRERRLDSILGKSSTNSGFVPISTSVNDGNKRQSPIWTGPTTADSITFAEYTCYRESSGGTLTWAYNDLLLTPRKSDTAPSREVAEAMANVSLGLPEMSWSRLSSDSWWLIQLYSKDAFERFGGLGIVERGLLPMGVVTLLRGRKVTWQTVL